MKRILMAVGFLTVVALLNAGTNENKNIMPIIDEMVGDVSDCDTIVVYGGYNVHIVKIIVC